MSLLAKLLSIASDPIAVSAVAVNLPDFEHFGELGQQLVGMLQQKNGLYAFESALHVFSGNAL